MMFDHTHNEDFIHGSARFSDTLHIQQAGLFEKDGLHLGHFDGRQIKIKSDGAILTVAGAGGGKTAALLGWTCCQSMDMPALVHDPRGELIAISRASMSRQDIWAYSWNPKGFHGLPSHSINPLDDITLDCPHFHSDIQVAAADLITVTTGESRYFGLRSREWVGAFMKHLVEREGKVSLPSLYRFVNLIEGDPLKWFDHAELMLKSQFEDVCRTAAEMLKKLDEAPKEAGGILGDIYASLSFLHDPVLRASLEGGDVSLSDLIDNPQTVRIHLMPPAEAIPVWSPALRLFFSRTMVLKSRKPSARRVLMLVDEAGQLGKAEFLQRAFTFSRGAGVVIHALFQDIGQIKRNFGSEGLISFIGSAVVRQFFGVRDYETAQLISNMLGQETLEHEDRAQQSRAAREARQRAYDILNGQDPFENGRDYAHFYAESKRRSKMRRPLMSADEIINMPENRQIIFVSGRDLHPIYAQKFRYFERREMAGTYLPNPFHPPSDRVRVKTRFGSKWLDVGEVTKPEAYRLHPQYPQNTALQIDGYPL